MANLWKKFPFEAFSSWTRLNYLGMEEHSTNILLPKLMSIWFDQDNHEIK